jgi:CHASE3 domain sensor protein
VGHSYPFVAEKLQAIRIDITQAETGQRGFVFTGQERDLALYEAGVSQVIQDVKDLSHLTADNPTQGEAIERLNPLIAGRLAELED